MSPAHLVMEPGGLQIQVQPGQFSETRPQKQKEDWARGSAVENMPRIS